MKTDVGSIVRTIVFILAWVNQFLATKNISPIPVDEVTISSIITGAVSLWTWWKNNNFSHAAQKGQQKLHEVKAGTNSTGGAPQTNGDDF
ncbi:MAG: phage holin [Staphylococcus epidermidis]|jgi:holin, SPP1 family|uniref:Holin n=2 Tax=Viruses TaxID=10239 RepID=A0AA49X2G9_9VIRU|nr:MULTISPECIES: phage holin [Staphylococcus]QLF86508.1 putative holin [Staphylococcus phage vB_SepS_BE01]QQV93241.1 holin [Staphylococcus virus vB_SepS_48]WEU70071.1 holin [Staphylococcus phage vB_SepS_BE21]WEU70771.1 holin [Staphylococcus phage vB_SepS_BE28]WLJ25782.1 MAG: holin [Staphylococcus phage HS09]SKU86608.1 holin, SPP1 family [Mycobacteroides abscessus subsp. abscessus]DAL31848.1 MAG TPA_asm: holin [Caudoviricetes sp.]